MMPYGLVESLMMRHDVRGISFKENCEIEKLLLKKKTDAVWTLPLPLKVLWLWEGDAPSVSSHRKWKYQFLSCRAAMTNGANNPQEAWNTVSNRVGIT